MVMTVETYVEIRMRSGSTNMQTKLNVAYSCSCHGSV
jgi:hypothetical protein